MPRRKITPRLGDIFEIPLPNGQLTYGHILRGNLIGFYAVQSDCRLLLEDLVRHGVAFRLVCTIDAIQTGGWPIIGNTPPPAPMNEPVRFWRSSASGALFTYEWRAESSEEETRATAVDIVGLEESVIWSSFAVIERLEHFFRGEPDPRVVIG